MPDPILTKHAPLLGADAALTGGRDLYESQQAALAEAQRVPGAGSAGDVRQAVDVYLHRMAADELAAIPGFLSDLLALLDDAAAIAYERSAATTDGEAHDWRTIARAIEGIRSGAEQVQKGDDPIERDREQLIVNDMTAEQVEDAVEQQMNDWIARNPAPADDERDPQ